MFNPELAKKFKSETGKYISIAQKKTRNHENVSNMVTISFSNSKMGKVASISLLPILTCHGRCAETCAEKCYAVKLCRLRPTVFESYARNTAVAINNPDALFKVINKTCRQVKFFRFHVSGDILNSDYFNRMIQTAKKNPTTEFLCFTKQYEIVNTWFVKNGSIPANFHILFSGWQNLKPINPYNLPETNVYKTESDFNESWTKCGGNCLNCALHGMGCWTANNGETIAFKMH